MGGKGRAALFAVLAVHGQSWAMSTGEAFSQAKTFGSAANPAVAAGPTTSKAQEVLPQYNMGGSEKSYFQNGLGNLMGPAVGKAGTCSSSPADPDRYKRQECNAINFLWQNPQTRPQFTIDKNNDPLLKAAEQVNKNPELYGSLNGLSGSYSGCKTVTIPGKQQYTTEHCTQSRALSEYTCNKILHVTCTQGYCSDGGIRKDSVVPSSNAGFRWIPEGQHIRLEVFRANDGGLVNHGYRGSFITLSLEFEVVDVSKIEYFTLEKVAYDDYATMWINGKHLASLPYGNNLGICTNDWVDSIDYMLSTEVGQCNEYPWNFGGGYERTYNFDARPYLVNGKNRLTWSIFLTEWYWTGGTGTFNFLIKQYCTTCTDSWEDQCTALQSRVSP